MGRRILKIIRTVLVLPVVWNAGQAALAQHVTPGVVLSGGYAGVGESPATKSFAAAVGGSLQAGKYFLAMATFDTATYKTGTNPRYSIDTFSNGVSRCRDSTNGQFAADILCQPGHAVLKAGMFDVNTLLPSVKAMIGGGYRTGADKGPYISGGFSQPFPNPHSRWFVRVTGGQKIFEVNIGMVMGFR